MGRGVIVAVSGLDEATPLDPDEQEGLKADASTREELDQLEQIAVTEGMIWLDRQERPDVLSEAFVRRLHKQLFGGVWEWAGTFRSTEKNIGVAPYQIASQLKNLLDNARYWVDHAVHPPKELAARFHYELVRIHPFPNGNGRHARILTDALLTRCLDEPAIRWEGEGGSPDGDSRRNEYIAALRAADEGEFESLLSFFDGDKKRGELERQGADPGPGGGR